MDNLPDDQGQPRRPRLVLPGAVDGPPRPKIILPGQGLIDPSAPLDDEAPLAIAKIEEAESIGAETEALVQDEPVLEPDAILLEETEEVAPPSDDFLADPPFDSLEIPPPPENQAAPAELKVIAPRRLGPPVGWIPPEFANEPDLPSQSFPQELPDEPYQVPAWQPEMTEYPPEVEAVETPEAETEVGAEADESEAFADYDSNAQAEYAVDGTWPEADVHPVVEPEDYPPEELVPLAHVPSPRIPRSLTSPHQVRPGTHQVSLRATNRYHTSVQPQTATASQPHAAPPAQQGNPLPLKPVIPAAERLLPAWLLVIIGLLLGAIGSIYAVARTPMGQKFGLVSRSESASYATELLKEERSQVQAMLDTYHERTQINLTEEMAEYRSEVGRKLPEKMTLKELSESAKAKPAGDAKTDTPADADKPAGEGKSGEPKADEPAK